MEEFLECKKNERFLFVAAWFVQNCLQQSDMFPEQEINELIKKIPVFISDLGNSEQIQEICWGVNYYLKNKQDEFDEHDHDE